MQIGGLPRKVNRVKKFTDDEKMELNLRKCKEIVIDFRRNKTIIPPIVTGGMNLKGSQLISYLDYGLMRT